MSKSQELLEQMEEICDQLIANAEELKKLSSLSATATEFQKLQLQQEQLIEELTEKDKKLPKELESKSAWKKLEKKLKEFESLNQAFIENLRIRQGLIQAELAEVKKTKGQVSEVKKVYSKKSKKGKLDKLS